MEKRTIGSFIAALRKANGLTQKQLAEKLCVSDKAVSRWERDECAPDLSAIPLLAEIFGVTCDELLRGQRSQPAQGSTEAAPERSSAKQLTHLLTATATRYKTSSAITAGISLVGLLAGMICNFAFQRGYLGFMIGCILLVVAAIYQTVITIQTNSGLNAGQFPADAISDARYTLFKTCRAVAAVILAILAAMLPFLTTGDAYFGIAMESWLPMAMIFAGISALISFAAGALIRSMLDRQGYFSLTDSQRRAVRHSKRYVITLVVCLICVWLLHLLSQSLAEELVCRGTVFDNWEDFKTCMEQPIQNGQFGSDLIINLPIDPDEQVGSYPYYSTQTITDSSGNILCQYIDRNETVCTISFSFDKSEDGLPVTVRTFQEMRQANNFVLRVVNPVFYALYLLVPLLLWLYFRKKRST